MTGETIERLPAATNAAPADAAATSRAASLPGTMRWYGWGVESEAFDGAGRPNLWPYVSAQLGISDRQSRNRPVPADEISLPAPVDNPQFLAALGGSLGTAQVSRSHMDRLLHAYGKSTRDLWRMRHGRVTYAPDCVLFPESEEQILAIVRAADQCGVALIPFGGGSNVAGCLEVHQPERRMIAAVNLRRLNRVLSIDRASCVARVQAGILGPDLEAALAAQGLTIGHFPDSFLYSTLGGWVATRSSGMFSDRYGNIEDMVLAVRMATPAGLIASRAVPHASNGPDVKRVCIGSEGTLGIITEVTLSVREAPAEREFRGYLFPDFESGVEALRECVRGGAAPALSRLHDPYRTRLSAAFRPKGSRTQDIVGAAFKTYLRRVRGMDLGQACLLIVGFEGNRRSCRMRRAAAEEIYRRYGAVSLGRGPGEAFAEGKFNFPYVRDFLMDYGAIADVGETSTVWSNILPLYRAATSAYRDALGRGGRKFWVGCHISHTYAAGASLYFTYAVAGKAGPEGQVDPWAELDHYLAAKQAGLASFSEHGATFSHHHAVGYEHLPWLLRENALAGTTVVDALKQSLDPNRIMNPGKLTAAYSLAELSAGPRTRSRN
jgi:alkyldihydroxyacetonephosphate synthase